MMLLISVTFGINNKGDDMKNNNRYDNNSSNNDKRKLVFSYL